MGKVLGKRPKGRTVQDASKPRIRPTETHGGIHGESLLEDLNNDNFKLACHYFILGVEAFTLVWLWQ